MLSTHGKLGLDDATLAHESTLCTEFTLAADSAALALAASASARLLSLMAFVTNTAATDVITIIPMQPAIIGVFESLALSSPEDSKALLSAATVALKVPLAESVVSSVAAVSNIVVTCMQM